METLGFVCIEVRVNVVRMYKNPWESESKSRNGQKTELLAIILFKGRGYKE